MCGLKGQSLVGSDPIALKPTGELPWGNVWSQEDPGDQNPTDVAVGQRKGGRAMSSLWPRMLDQGELHGEGEAKERETELLPIQGILPSFPTKSALQRERKKFYL